MAKKPAPEATGTTEGAAEPVATLTIQGIHFTAPTPFAEGHVCSLEESRALNQTFGENLRNNFASVVRDAKVKAATDAGTITAESPKADVDAAVSNVTLDDTTVAALKEKFAAYSAEYKFTAKRQSRAPVDPVEREAFKLAKAAVETKLREKNIDKKALKEGQLESLVTSLLAKVPDYREEAKRRVEAMKSTANTALDDLFADAA